MNIPTPEVPIEERLLGDLASVQKCSNVRDYAKAIIRSRPGYLSDHERVYVSNEFGYVIRYKIFEEIEGFDGQSVKVISYFIVWTQDCKEFRAASFGAYEFL